MKYIRCSACPAKIQCDESDMCVDSLVINRARSVAFIADTQPNPCGPHETPPAPPMPAQAPTNGVGWPRPAAGTTTGKVWQIADEVSKTHEGKALRLEVVSRCVTIGINKSTVSVQFGKWLATMTKISN